MDERNTGLKILKKIIQKENNAVVIEQELFSSVERYCKQKSIDNFEDFYKLGLYQIYNDLLSGLSIIDVQKQLKNNQIFWKHKHYEKLSFDEIEQDNFILVPFEVKEGVAKCLKCHSEKAYIYQRQSRSSDEPMTTYAQCVECNAKWTYSG